MLGDAGARIGEEKWVRLKCVAGEEGLVEAVVGVEGVGVGHG